MIILLFAWLVALGFIRDILIKNLNLLLANHFVNGFPYTPDNSFGLLEQVDYNILYALKWLIIILMTVAYAWTTILILNRITQSSYTRSVLRFYGLLLISTAMIYFIFFVLGYGQTGYEIGRHPLEWAQSPIPFLLLWAASKLKQNQV